MRVGALVAGVGLTLAGVTFLSVPRALGQTMDYVALGDSTTYGTNFPSHNGQGTFCGNNYSGGYPTRLKNLLGSGFTVDNKGVNGDTTVQMLSRANSAIQSGDEVLLLMGGLNDIYQNPGISTNTIKSTLNSIANVAAGKAVDTVFASTSRFHYLVPNQSNLNSKATSLRNDVIALANGGSGYFVDNWSSLCPNNSCFQNDYYHACVTEGVDVVGHPDNSGYDIMAPLFKNEIQKNAVPGAPATSSPSGDTAPPTSYSWTIGANNAGNATWFQVQVEGPGGSKLNAWYRERFVCSGSSCSISPSIGYTTGSYSWRVRGRSPRGFSSWTSYRNFFVYASVPAKVTTSAPEGDFWDLDPVNFTYEWSTVANTTQYQLDVDISGGAGVIDQTYNSGTVCSGSSCEATPATALSAGTYTWRVRGINPNGNGTWSDWRDINLIDTLPTTPVPGYPNDETFVDLPRYTWLAADGADSYTLEIFDSGSSSIFQMPYDAATVCVEAQCSVVAAHPLGVGDFSWTITGGNPNGNGPTSGEQAFTRLACSPTTLDLDDDTITTTETFQACETIRAGDLFGSGDWVIGSGGVVTIHAGDLITLEDGFAVLDGGELEVRADLQ